MRRNIVQRQEERSLSARVEDRRTIAAELRRALAILLVAGVAAACTVRVELTSQRAVPGDLAATSSGLAKHHGWSDDVLDERPEPPARGLALAAVLPPDDPRGPIELLPTEDPRTTAVEGDVGPLAEAPATALRPAVQVVDDMNSPPTEPASLPAATRVAGENRDVAATIRPAAGPP
jgi:hypothetical protein